VSHPYGGKDSSPRKRRSSAWSRISFMIFLVPRLDEKSSKIECWQKVTGFAWRRCGQIVFSADAAVKKRGPPISASLSFWFAPRPPPKTSMACR